MKIERIESLKANTNNNFKAKSTNNPIKTNTFSSLNELNGITATY